MKKDFDFPFVPKLVLENYTILLHKKGEKNCIGKLFKIAKDYFLSPVSFSFVRTGPINSKGSSISTNVSVFISNKPDISKGQIALSLGETLYLKDKETDVISKYYKMLVKKKVMFINRTYICLIDNNGKWILVESPNIL